MVRQATEPVPLAEAMRELLLDHVDERERDRERIDQAWREGVLHGIDLGWRGGYEQAWREIE
jgi:hypothetical protein